MVPNSPADSAGVRVGDTILEIDGFNPATRPDSGRFRGVGIPSIMRVRRGRDTLSFVIVPREQKERCVGDLIRRPR